MRQSIKALLAQSVDEVIRRHYPTQYSSLCHVYAIVGSNLISIMGEQDFRPVAGLAAVDCGKGQILFMADNSAFSRPEGGAFHCWIESTDSSPCERQVVDFMSSIATIAAVPIALKTPAPRSRCSRLSQPDSDWKARQRCRFNKPIYVCKQNPLGGSAN